MPINANACTPIILSPVTHIGRDSVNSISKPTPVLKLNVKWKPNNLNKLKRKNHNLEYVWNVYKNKYKPTLGSNLWSVYNALTDWSTHANATTSRGKANIASIRNNRQNSVRKTFTKYLEVAW